MSQCPVRAVPRNRASGAFSRTARHGTNSGYSTHVKYGTPTCDACKEAHAAYWLERRGQPAVTTEGDK